MPEILGDDCVSGSCRQYLAPQYFVTTLYGPVDAKDCWYATLLRGLDSPYARYCKLVAALVRLVLSNHDNSPVFLFTSVPYIVILNSNLSKKFVIKR